MDPATWTMFLDKSRVPPEKLDDPRLKKMEVGALRDMQDSKYRLHVCVHEAAHGVYLERAGAIRLIYHGPVARYDAAKDTFNIASAAIQPGFGEQGVTADSLVMARYYVAGEVAQRVLTDFLDQDKVVERQDFEDFVSELRRHLSQAGLTLTDEVISQHWEQAKIDVERDLRSPAFRQELWRRARDFEAWLLAQTPNVDFA